MSSRPNRRALSPRARIEKWIRDGKLTESPSGCWVWSGSLTANGYGQIAMSSKTIGVVGGPIVHFMLHRWMYELHVGEIPEGLDLDHLCRVRACCNPWHLEPVTRSENLSRGEVGRYKLQRTHCSAGHEYTPENTTRARDGSRMCRACRQGYAETRRQKVMSA